jgi:hypothetical protein
VVVEDGQRKPPANVVRLDMRNLIAIVVVAWLVIGVLAAVQRGYFGSGQDVNCKTFSDTALTVVAGPLNYVGANPKVSCHTPRPSK